MLSAAGYVGSVIAIIAAGVIVQFMKTWRNDKEAHWYQIYSTQQDCGECPIWQNCSTDTCEPECSGCSQDIQEKKPRRVFMTVQQARRNTIRSLCTGRADTTWFSTHGLLPHFVFIVLLMSLSWYSISSKSGFVTGSISNLCELKRKYSPSFTRRV